MSDDCLFPACDHMVASLDDDQFRYVTVDEPHRPVIFSGCAVYVKLLCTEDIVSSQFHDSEAFHEFRRVGRVESGTEELSVPACVLNYGSGCYEHQTGRLYRYYTSIYYNYI